MTPEQQNQIKADHEAGHAAVALEMAMLGNEGVSIEESEEGTGYTSISWDPRGFTEPARIKQRATVSMAGAAADFDKRKEGRHINGCMSPDGHVDWYQVFCSCEDLRPDIQKARRLHIIANTTGALRPAIEVCLSENAGAPEDKILDILFSESKLQSLYQQLSYDMVDMYFVLAKDVLSLSHVKRFVEEASARLLEQGNLSSVECLKLWRRPEVFAG